MNKISKPRSVSTIKRDHVTEETLKSCHSWQTTHGQVIWISKIENSIEMFNAVFGFLIFLFVRLEEKEMPSGRILIFSFYLTSQ